MKGSPYQIIKSRHVSEKASLIESLKDLEGSRSLTRCESPKYVFIVDPKATKQEIASAVEKIYEADNIQVVKVNTINVKPKKKGKRGRNRLPGRSASFRKAIVTLKPGNLINE